MQKYATRQKPGRPSRAELCSIAEEKLTVGNLVVTRDLLFSSVKRPSSLTILQRVLSASVTVENEVVSSIKRGILVFAAIAPGDTQKEADTLAAKVLNLKLWDDDSGARWKKNVQEIDGEVLCVSQFTLLASTKKGKKPDFHGAAGGEESKNLYQYFFEKVQKGYAPEKVKDGVFQAMMQVALVNDGPVRTPVPLMELGHFVNRVQGHIGNISCPKGRINAKSFPGASAVWLGFVIAIGSQHYPH
ncbi:D-Tyr tRNAtyr deacylase-like domain-containing protein [Xylaria nigripes]|nr:D-Tyr tRNAtyr deacylase-like domain-containing protein [Xylaria nigripes]